MFEIRYVFCHCFFVFISGFLAISQLEDFSALQIFVGGFLYFLDERRSQAGFKSRHLEFYTPYFPIHLHFHIFFWYFSLLLHVPHWLFHTQHPEQVRQPFKNIDPSSLSFNVPPLLHFAMFMYIVQWTMVLLWILASPASLDGVSMIVHQITQGWLIG